MGVARTILLWLFGIGLGFLIAAAILFVVDFFQRGGAVDKCAWRTEVVRLLTSIDTRLQNLADVLAHQGERIMATLDDLSADVADEASVIGSVETLLTNLSAQLAAAGTDPTKIQAIKDAIDANKARLSAAVVANTPAAPPA